MPKILVENLTKSFKVAERTPGFWGAVKGIVHRRYRTVNALDGISFSIEPGELVGYIGPNGAGKSTTVKVISGILVPDSGRCEIDGIVPWVSRTQHVNAIGVVFGQLTQLWWDLPVIESFDLLKDIYRIPADAYETTRSDLVDRLDLGGFLDVPVRQLSLGQRMRRDIAASLLHSPNILFLDESTIGLDAVSKLAVRDFVKHLNREHGGTVILTTHDMDDIEALCTRIMVIGEGRILSDSTIDELRNRISTERRLIIDFDTEGVVVSDPHAEVVTQQGHRVELRFKPELTSAADLISRISSKQPVRDLFVENPPIEEIIARMYEDQAS